MVHEVEEHVDKQIEEMSKRVVGQMSGKYKEIHKMFVKGGVRALHQVVVKKTAETLPIGEPYETADKGYDLHFKE